MKEEFIETIMQQMLPYLDNVQMEKLKDTLHYCMHDVEIVTDSSKLPKPVETNESLLSKFLAAKRVEGCSVKTLNYYQSVLLKLFSMVPVSVLHMKTEHIRSYLSAYADRTKCSKSNLDNIRRILSSFFTWLEEESYILKNPVRRIHKIKVDKTVKETYSDEAMERMRDECHCLRDLAIIDLLASSGMRVGELVRLNREDIDFDNRECIVFGKGSKERPVYFDARTKSI